MPTPNLDQVLQEGNASVRDIRVGNIIGFGRNTSDTDNPAVTLTYEKDIITDLAEIHLRPRGANQFNTRTVFHDTGHGVWVHDDTLDETFVTTSPLGLHTSRNLTAHMSVAGRLYVESTEGFVKAKTFLLTQAAQVRFLGEGPTRPQLWYDTTPAHPEFVLNDDSSVDPAAVGASPLRAANTLTSKGTFYYNENLAGGGPGGRLTGTYNVASVNMPNLGIGDPSLIRVTYVRPITDPVVTVTPIANNISNGDPITGNDPAPIVASIIRSRPEYFEVMLWQALCTPSKVVVRNYGFNVFNDIGFHFQVSSPITAP